MSGIIDGARSAGRPHRLPPHIDPTELLADFRLGCISRSLDDREITLQKQSRAFFQIASAGHEALGTALARHLRPGVDWLFPYYRDGALMLGIGVTAEEILLQSVGSALDPASGGRQMPNHWGSRRCNVPASSSPTGSQCLPAVGCAEASVYLRDHRGTAMPVSHTDEITVVSLGEGAASEGEFWEAVNSACVSRLPLLFVVADNGYAISTPAYEQHSAPVSALVSGFAHLEVSSVDGWDYVAVRQAAQRAVAHVRIGKGPALLEARVTRPYSHSGQDTQSKYRTAAEIESEQHRDPLDRMQWLLVASGVASAARCDEIRAEARAEVAAAAERALAAPKPDPATATDHVWALPDVIERPELRTPVGVEPAALTLGQSISATLHEAMAADDRIRVFGEDVADAPEAIVGQVEGKGGVFGITAGLQRTFGADRCYNTPLAEAAIVGRAIGQAVRGLRPVAEIQFFDYIWPAMQQLRSEAATLRWRSNGTWSCPAVIRVFIGGYLTGGAIWHSQCGEAIFTHIPGIVVAFPSTAADAAGLLRTALRHGSDPVLFCEHKHLLRQPSTAEPFPDPGYEIPFGSGRIRRPGQHCTVVTWAATVQFCLDAADRIAAADGSEVEVIDLRTLAPWDRAMVAESVSRTNRLLVVHEDTLTGGFGAEIAAWVGEHCFSDLDAPVSRVGALDTPVGYDPGLEDAILPQPDRVEAAIRTVLEF